MLMVSMDVETTGLDPEYCQLLEVGAIIFDPYKPDVRIETLPRFHCYVPHRVIHGQPFALAMHEKILKRIDARTPGYNYVEEGDLGPELFAWLHKNGFNEEDKGALRVSVAGKNFGSFDKNFLEKIKNFRQHIKFRHRILDPTILFAEPTDEELPNTATCCKRAGISDSETHTALADCEMVIKLLITGMAKRGFFRNQ